MIQSAVVFGLWAIGIAIALCFYRLVKGPTIADRVVAADTIATNLLGIIALSAIRTGEKFFVLAMLALTILAFVGTTVFAKFLERGRIIE